MMADEGDPESSSGDTNDSSNEDGIESETELMVTSRTRRATAGNRYNHVVAQEQVGEDQEDDVALLFADVEGEDEEYNSDEGADDADMSSSDDDNDQGPNAAADDVDGEKELQSQAKAEKARKRKAELALTTISAIRKKPRFDPSSIRGVSKAKPAKRKERVSWLPDSDLASGRTSLRAQTIAHRAETHAKLQENEKLRLKAKAKRAQRQKEREADAPKALTQADRLAEAERVERRNAKSLNRWEAMEKKRAEEQAAKLAALKDRKLDGAVITFHSVRHIFNGWRSKENIDGETGEVKKRGRKSKAYLEQLAAAKLLEQQASAPLAEGMVSTLPIHDASPAGTKPSTDPTMIQQDITPIVQHAGQTTAVISKPDDHFLSGIHEFASMNVDVQRNESRDVTPSSKVVQSIGSSEAAMEVEPAHIDLDQPNSGKESLIGTSDNQPPVNTGTPHDEITENKTAPNQDAEAANQQQLPSQQLPEPLTTLPDADHVVAESARSNTNQSPLTAAAVQDNVSAADNNPSTLEQLDNITKTSSNRDIQHLTEPLAGENPLIEPTEHKASAPAAPAAPLLPEVTSIRNLVILDKFDRLGQSARNEFNVLYNTRKSSKLVKHTPELCPITGLPICYRDPTTSLGYHNAAAFKKIQELRQHRYIWSSMLGCYIGRNDIVARGVLEGFNG